MNYFLCSLAKVQNCIFYLVVYSSRLYTFRYNSINLIKNTNCLVWYVLIIFKFLILSGSGSSDGSSSSLPPAYDVTREQPRNVTQQRKRGWGNDRLKRGFRIRVQSSHAGYGHWWKRTAGTSRSPGKYDPGITWNYCDSCGSFFK